MTDQEIQAEAYRIVAAFLYVDIEHKVREFCEAQKKFSEEDIQAILRVAWEIHKQLITKAGWKEQGG